MKSLNILHFLRRPVLGAVLLLYGEALGLADNRLSITELELRLNELNDELEDIAARGQEIASQQHATAQQLEREYDRNGKLRRALLSEQTRGCRALEPISDLEIEIQGSHLGDSDWDRTATAEEKKNEGQPERISFQFSDDLILEQNDEISTPVFSRDGYLHSEGLETFTPADIDFVKVIKWGTGYRSELNCWNILGWSRWGFGKNCEWQNRETHRYQLHQLTIRINGTVFFHSPKVDHTFADGKFSWSKSDLSESQEYLFFMTDPTCR